MLHCAAPLSISPSHPPCLSLVCIISISVKAAGQLSRPHPHPPLHSLVTAFVTCGLYLILTRYEQQNQKLTKLSLILCLLFADGNNNAPQSEHILRSRRILGLLKHNWRLEAWPSVAPTTTDLCLTCARPGLGFGFGCGCGCALRAAGQRACVPHKAQAFEKGHALWAVFGLWA